MKLIEILRGKLEYSLELVNGDQYDSIINVYDGWSKDVQLTGLKKIVSIPFVNTDHTVGYAGGILSPGEYWGVCGTHKSKYKAILLFQGDGESVTDWSKLTEPQRTLPSLVANPNHSGKMVISYVNIHKGGLSYDWSHGCITVVTNELLFDYWGAFINCFEYNEVAKVILSGRVG